MSRCEYLDVYPFTLYGSIARKAGQNRGATLSTGEIKGLAVVMTRAPMWEKIKARKGSSQR